ALGHELVEFGLVLGVPQAVEKFLELALLLLKATQGFGTIFVKRPVAARGWPLAPPSGRISLIAPLRMAPATARPLCHPPAAHEISQNDEPERPPDQETHHRQGDPSRIAEIIELCREGHRRASCECI